MMNYKKPEAKNWIGRVSLSSDAYWHEAVELVDFTERDFDELDLEGHPVALLGYAADEGVQRNLGRVGAVNGPNHIRTNLGKLPIHFANNNIFDFGDITCEENGMEGGQAVLANTVSQLIDSGLFPIVMGGGHDIAFGHFVGISNSAMAQGKSIGIINFDAHFDLRAVEEEGNSGTPFYQIKQRLEKAGSDFHYLAVGIQEQGNTTELFDYANSVGTEYILAEDCTDAHLAEVTEKVQNFVMDVDCVYITIDMDGFSSAYAPGVSAPSAFGFTPQLVQSVLKSILATGKVISTDIAELNPEFDQDGCTAKLAARLVDILARYRK
jgi:formiminoglutamase